VLKDNAPIARVRVFSDTKPSRFIFNKMPSMNSEEVRSVVELKGPSRKATAVRRIVVIDDHPIMRHGMIALINAESDMQVCAEAETYRTGLDAMRLYQPDAVVVDLGLPDVDGMELIKVLRDEQPALAILVISMHSESEYALRALRAGANGYIVKSDAATNVVAGLRKVLNGELSLSPNFSDRLIFQIIRAPAAPGNSPVDRLTQREREVLELIGQGLGTREVGRRLNISVKTVETHRGHLKEKLKLQTSGELTRFAMDWVAQKG
jgi:DNA-binding NarL/FixJ family response regulator